MLEIKADEEAVLPGRECAAAEKSISPEKKRRTDTAIVSAVIAACIAFAVVLITVIIPNRNKAPYQPEDIKIGDTYRFGSYEQDNIFSNGKEEIEWTVLDKDGSCLLLISKYALDCLPYNTSCAEVTWETCSLRTWLNGTFLSEAFSPEERERIKSSYVTAEKNPTYGTSPGNDTKDKVFLLSIAEVKKYFVSDGERLCEGTDRCYAQGALKFDNGCCWWWLRSPGYDPDVAAIVNYFGTVYEHGSYVVVSTGAVRPALWIDLGVNTDKN